MVPLAEQMYRERQQERQEKAFFHDPLHVSFHPDEATENELHAEYWYAQPSHIQETGQVHMAFLDASHALANLRVKVCRTGLPARGIMKEAVSTTAVLDGFNFCDFWLDCLRF